jgi:hypothetical protein
MSRTITLPDSMAEALSNTLKQELENLVNRTVEIRKILGELQNGGNSSATTLSPAKRSYTRRVHHKKKDSKGNKAMSFIRKPGDPTITETLLNIVRTSRQPLSVAEVCTEFNKQKGFKKMLSTRHSSSVSAILYQQTMPNKPLSREQRDGTWVYKFTDPRAAGKETESERTQRTGQPGPNHFANKS